MIWEGKAENSGQNLDVMLNPIDPQQFGRGAATVKTDGSFSLSNIGEGLNRVRVLGLGNSSFLKMVRYGNTQKSVQELTVNPGVESLLELIVSSNGVRIEGAVTTSESLPAAGAWVVLVPGAPNRSRGWLYKPTNSDQNGRFTLRGIPPGEYQLFRWDGAEEGAWQNADSLRPFEEKGLGESISIQEGDAKSVNLTTIKTVGTEEQKP